MQPREKMSDDAFLLSQPITSGALYFSVIPWGSPVVVLMSSRLVSKERPKSVKRTEPLWTRIFAGFMSSTDQHFPSFCII